MRGSRHVEWRLGLRTWTSAAVSPAPPLAPTLAPQMSARARLYRQCHCAHQTSLPLPLPPPQKPLRFVHKRMNRGQHQTGPPAQHTKTSTEKHTRNGQPSGTHQSRMKSRDDSSAPIPDPPRGLWSESGVLVKFDQSPIAVFCSDKNEVKKKNSPGCVTCVSGEATDRHIDSPRLTPHQSSP